MQMLPSHGRLVDLEKRWLVGDSISCASVGVFWDACVGLAGLLQVRAVSMGLRVTMCWRGSVRRAGLQGADIESRTDPTRQWTVRLVDRKRN
jgi:hypothetical protein